VARGEVVRGGEPVAPRADDDDVIAAMGIGVPPEELGMFQEP
jgi:hypothetical protein